MHILNPESRHIFVPTAAKVKNAKEFGTGAKVAFTKETDGIMLHLDNENDRGHGNNQNIDYIVELDAPLK